MSCRPRAWYSALAVLVVLASALVATASPTVAAASGSPGRQASTGPSALPPGWSIEPGAAGEELRWYGGTVRMGGARPEMLLGDRVLGAPRDLDGSLRLALSARELAEVRSAPQTLAVWSAGRRLDGSRRQRSEPPGPAAGSGSAPATEVVDVDPASRGRFDSVRRSYELAPLPVAPYPAAVEVVAEVTEPAGAPGRRPLVLILHGRHATCFNGGPEGNLGAQWPCPDGWAPVPSHLGYRYLTDVLASQGFIAVSLAANGINGQDFLTPDGGASARSGLLRHHLALWSRWDAVGGDPWGGIFRGRVDLSNVVLVGHSRGGEGVNRAAIDARPADPYRIRGLVSYGPTAFGQQVSPDVASAVILPACDGDVSDLQGQAYVDASRDVAPSRALRSAVLALGANHNYFNSEWTPGLSAAPSSDDWFDPSDPVCGDEGSLRLTPRQQQRVGAVYTLALIRSTTVGDPAAVRLLDGSKVTPRVIAPAQVSVSPVGGDAKMLYRPEDPGTPRLALGMTGHECQGYDHEAEFEFGPVPTCIDGFSDGASPHWIRMYDVRTRPAPLALALSWERARATAVLAHRAEGVDLSRFDTIDVRIANDPHRSPAQLAVRIRDAHGRVALLDGDLPSIDGWPGTGSLDRVQARTLRAALPQDGTVDVRRVTSVELVARGAGRVWVLDARAVRHGPTQPAALDLPVVSVDAVEALEGGEGEVTTVDVAIRVEGTVRHPATVWVETESFDDAGGLVYAGSPLHIPAGASGVVTTVPITFEGDDLYETDPFGLRFDGGRISLAAVRGALTGDYIGGVSVIEDEETPTLSVDAREVSATEGDSLIWTLRLSAPTGGAFYLFAAEPPPGGATEVDSDDVDQRWLQRRLEGVGGDVTLPLDPPVPLSDLGRDVNGFGLPLFLFFEPGATEAAIEVPLRHDRRTEGDELVVFEVHDIFGDPTIPAGGVSVVGMVRAHDALDGLPDWALDAVSIGDRLGDSPEEESAIDTIIGTAPVVLAGRMSRGLGQVAAVHTDLVADLVERAGVAAVVFDEPVATSVAAAHFAVLGARSADGAVAGFADEVDRTEEFTDLLTGLRAHNETAAAPVLVAGIDPGTDPSALVDVVASADPDLAARLGCFDLDEQGAAGWSSRPADERASCRADLTGVRDELASAAPSGGATAAALDAFLANVAAESLLSLEAMASVDRTAPGAAGEVASLRAEALAAGIRATMLRSSPGRVVALVDDLDAAVLTDVDEPRVVPGTESAPPTTTTVRVRASTASLLASALGRDRVATVGISVGGGELRAYTSDGDRVLTRVGLDRPIRGSVDDALATFGPEPGAFVAPTAGSVSLHEPAPARIGVRADYVEAEPSAWYVAVPVGSAYDGMVHVPDVTATSLLSQRPRLLIDEVAVDLGEPCIRQEDGTMVALFSGGRLAMRVEHDEATDSLVADVEVIVDDDGYTGRLPLDEADGWSFRGPLQSAGGDHIDIVGFLPWDGELCDGEL